MKTRATIIAFVSTLAVGAAAPAASHAVPRKIPNAPAKIRAVKPKKGAAIKHVLVNGRNGWTQRCGMAEIFINNELDAAQKAFDDGNYGEVGKHLAEASEIAAAAVKDGCSIRA